jgi:hypothetical protein
MSVFEIEFTAIIFVPIGAQTSVHPVSVVEEASGSEK